MAKSILKDKSYKFALKIVFLSKELNENKEFVLAKQLLRSGTAVGALVREAEFAQSKKDFIHKLSIALKEANETDYWLLLLSDSKIISKEIFEPLNDDILELIRILVSSIKTSKSKLTRSE